jgi:hypothetical protein
MGERVFVRYRIYFWNAPILRLDQEIQIGKEIAREGRDSFLRRHHPYLGDDEQQRIAATAQMTPALKSRAFVLAALFFVPIIIFVGPGLLIVLALALPVLVLSIGSMLIARSRYHRWVDEMIRQTCCQLTQWRRMNNLRNSAQTLTFDIMRAR